jgi:hypothetical protein
MRYFRRDEIPTPGGSTRSLLRLAGGASERKAAFLAKQAASLGRGKHFC